MGRVWIVVGISITAGAAVALMGLRTGAVSDPPLEPPERALAAVADERPRPAAQTAADPLNAPSEPRSTDEAEPVLPEGKMAVPVRGPDGRPDLDATRQAFHDLFTAGRYAEADRMIWWLWTKADAYSEHGENFQFMLANGWVQLAAAYPPAERSLRLARDHSFKRYEDGGEYFPLVEVMRIDDALGETERTVELVDHVARTRPERLPDAVDVAFDALFAAERYELLAEHLPPAEEIAEEAEASLLESLASTRKMFAERAAIRAHVSWVDMVEGTESFAREDLVKRATVLRETGQAEDADALLERFDAFLTGYELPPE